MNDITQWLNDVKARCAAAEKDYKSYKGTMVVVGAAELAKIAITELPTALSVIEAIYETCLEIASNDDCDSSEKHVATHIKSLITTKLAEQEG